MSVIYLPLLLGVSLLGRGIFSTTKNHATVQPVYQARRGKDDDTIEITARWVTGKKPGKLINEIPVEGPSTL